MFLMPPYHEVRKNTKPHEEELFLATESQKHGAAVGRNPRWSGASTPARLHTRIGRPPSHGGTERRGFDARRDAPATRPDAVVHESQEPVSDSCTAACGRVLGLLC